MPKDQVSKFFRVATEGATTDGRTISKEWISQMAKNFNPKKYGARVWLEHYRGIAPDGLFRAYGDVVSVEAREVEDKKLALFAQLKPTSDLIDLNKKSQKIYTSIEVTPKFADTGEAYLTGLAVTDSPASLGTDVLSFAQQKPQASPFTGRKSTPDALFSEAIEAALEFEDEANAQDDGTLQKFSTTIKDIITKATGRGKSDDARFSQMLEGMEALADALQDEAKRHSEQRSATDKALADLKSTVEQQQKHFADLLTKLESTPGSQFKQRPAATGATSDAPQTNC